MRLRYLIFSISSRSFDFVHGAVSQITRAPCDERKSAAASYSETSQRSYSTSPIVPRAVPLRQSSGKELPEGREHHHDVGTESVDVPTLRPVVAPGLVARTGSEDVGDTAPTDGAPSQGPVVNDGLARPCAPTLDAAANGLRDRVAHDEDARRWRIDRRGRCRVDAGGGGRRRWWEVVAYRLVDERGFRRLAVTPTSATHNAPATAGANAQRPRLSVRRLPSRTGRSSQRYEHTDSATVTAARTQNSGRRDRSVRSASSQRKIGQW